MNILSNAIDALEHDTIPSDREVQSSNTITIRTRVNSDRTILVQIADNGPGIPHEAQCRIFDPFFTTKPIGKGTGLGLSISYQIITEKHQGTLQCRSEIGQGTEFLLEIPIRQEAVATTSRSA